jgi:hypothetical protein
MGGDVTVTSEPGRARRSRWACRPARTPRIRQHRTLGGGHAQHRRGLCAVIADTCAVVRARPTNFASRTSSENSERPRDEIAAVDEFRYRARMPSRAAAVRELLRRALVSVGEGRLTTLNEQGELPVLEWIAVSGSDYCDAVRRRDEVP